MKYIAIVLCVIALTAGFHRRSRIWGGQEATSGQFPYMVVLNDAREYCGGVIIAPRWILTAAKCLYYISTEATVYIGSHINEVNGTAYKINDVIAHEGYDEMTYQNDIGLIKLSTDLVFGDTIQAIQFSESVTVNATCTVVGWGTSENEIFPATLRYVDVPVIDMELCQDIAADYFEDRYLGPEQICSLAPEGQSACYGDEGGPLVCDGKLAGILSYNVYNVCSLQVPNVYSSISTYLNWILAAIQP